MIAIIPHLTIIFIAFSSLLAGRMLYKIAPEEFKPGTKYLINTLSISFILFHITIAVFSQNITITILAIGILLFYMYKYHTHTLHNNNCYIVYTLFGFFLGTMPINSILLPAIITFTGGMVLSVLIHKKRYDVFIRMMTVFTLFYTISAVLL
ncbi:MAG: hypothetical protein ACMXYE_03765 [Candidatus Woesearchaeota archaeon]